jgi:hypothetical protein
MLHEFSGPEFPGQHQKNGYRLPSLFTFGVDNKDSDGMSSGCLLAHGVLTTSLCRAVPKVQNAGRLS